MHHSIRNHDRRHRPIAQDTLVDRFVNYSSLATARDTIKLYAGARYITNLEHTEDVSILKALPSILEPHSSLPLAAMSRTNRHDRMDSRSFVVAMKRKLRLELWPQPSAPNCVCADVLSSLSSVHMSCEAESDSTLFDGLTA